MSTPADRQRPVVVMGVSGSGKSTVGAALARRLGVPFADADDLHPDANVAKMSGGEPLDDADRWPWLDEVGRWLADRGGDGGGGGGVIACSALRRAYRDRLRSHCPDVRFVHLGGDADLIAERQSGRSGHFMPSSLQASQQATLEPLGPDEDGLVVDVAGSVADVVDDAVARLGAAEPPPAPRS